MGMPSSDLVELGKQEEKKRKGDSEREWSEVRSRGRMRLLVSWSPGRVRIAFVVLQAERVSVFVF